MILTVKTTILALLLFNVFTTAKFSYALTNPENPLSNESATAQPDSRDDDNLFLEADCLKRGGKIISQWSCPSAQWLRKGPFCEILDANGTSIVFNGCDVSLFGYGKVFYSACLKHDLCYHHEPAASGQDKFQCDIHFYIDMLKICKNSDSPNACEFMAYTYYEGVDLGGARAWGCSKVKADYLPLVKN